MGDYVLWYSKGANVHAGKLRSKWFGPYRVQYLLPNNTVFLVTVDKFDPDPVIVNINKLKTYRCPEEGLLDLSSSENQTKTQLIEASFENEDEPTGDVGTHPVILASVIQPVPNPKTALHLDTSSLNRPITKPSHPQPQGGNLSSISKSLPFQMERVSTRVPYQPQPKTITTPEAATILSSFTFLQLSHLHPSNSQVFAQRVIIVPPIERPSTEWRGKSRKRPGSTTPSVLSSRRLMYMTYHYQAHMYIAQWREQAKSDLVEHAYIEKMGTLPFVNMNWADPNSAPRMRLIEEFINGAFHHPDRMEAKVDGKTCVINVALITQFLHLSIGDTAEILAEP